MISFKNLQQVYALFICLISMIVLLFSAGNFLDDSTRLLFPSYRNASQLLTFQSNEAYLQHHNFGGDAERLEAKKLFPEKLTEKRLLDQKHYMEVEHFRTLDSLIKTIQWILVALLFFWLHWRLYKKSNRK